MFVGDGVGKLERQDLAPLPRRQVRLLRQLTLDAGPRGRSPAARRPRAASQLYSPNVLALLSDQGDRAVVVQGQHPEREVLHVHHAVERRLAGRRDWPALGDRDPGIVVDDPALIARPVRLRAGASSSAFGPFDPRIARRALIHEAPLPVPAKAPPSDRHRSRATGIRRAPADRAFAAGACVHGPPPLGLGPDAARARPHRRRARSAAAPGRPRARPRQARPLAVHRHRRPGQGADRRAADGARAQARRRAQGDRRARQVHRPAPGRLRGLPRTSGPATFPNGSS